MPYRLLDPRTQLEQTVSTDLDSALGKRGATVTHHGTPAAPAPASAPCDISVAYGSKDKPRALMVEVAQRPDATEFQSIVSHLEAWENTKGGLVDLLYSGRSTSARMARLIRNENQRRAAEGRSGRIVFLKLDDLEAFLERWRGLPKEESPAERLSDIFVRHPECIDDLASAEVFRQCVFPDWTVKRDELSAEAAERLASQQERLKKDIQKLENKLRERGVTGPRAHKYLIYLFFMALYEDQRGKETRATKSGFLAYRDKVPNSAKNSPEFRERTAHHLISQEILEDHAIRDAGIASQYERLDLPDDFILAHVIPVFENYSFVDASIDAVGAVFEALARRAEKDNRIGQFFTPEVAVAATCRLVGLRPTDLVVDPACGTGRFLIRAMTDMCAQAMNVPSKTKAEAVDDIKQHLILGCDIDPWMAVIAKMNMYIHGDGKTNIRRANGLTLATVASFSPEHPDPLGDSVDVVVTNPPLGDIDFQTVAEEVAKSQLPAQHTDADLTRVASEWSKCNLDVVPHKVLEEEVRKKTTAKADEWRAVAVEAKFRGDVRAEDRARKRVAEWEAKQHNADLLIGAGKLTYQPAGRTAKGGALFLSSMSRCLKPARDASLPVEWRGGVMGLVIDEAVLNTRDYATARVFLRRHYFLKAVVSLPRDTFADLAKTTAKTSILVLVRKEDEDTIQRESVFFARAEQTGPSGRDLRRPNDLISICDAFDGWRSAILAAHRAPTSPPALISNDAPIQVAAWGLDPAKPEERLDEAYWCMKSLIKLMPDVLPLSEVADLVSPGERVPPEQDVYSFASVSRVEARVRPKGETDTLYTVDDLREVHEDDVLVSGIDLVHGSVAVVSAECAGMVVSKEYFILRAKAGYDPHWLAALLRTPAMRRIIEGTITGTSNRTRVESPDVLMNLPLPMPPEPEVRKQVGNALRAAQEHQRAMVDSIEQAEALAAQASALPFGSAISGV